MLRLLHPLDELGAGGAPGIGVGVGQEHPFGEVFRRRLDQHARGGDPFEDLRRGHPLGNGQPVDQRLALGDHRQHLAQAGAGRELVFAGLQRPAMQPGIGRGHDEAIGMGDDPMLLQAVGDVLGIHAALDHDGADPGERPRAVEFAAGIIDSDRNDQNGHQEADQKRAENAKKRTAAAAAGTGHPR